MNLAANFESVRHRMVAACTRVGRDPATVALLAVTKAQPPEAVRAAAELGQTLFGENKVQEAKAKIPLCPGHLRWHMIGHLQTNKCRDAVQLFEMVQGVDSLHLAEELNRQCERWAKRMAILVEVNVAAESSKFGYPPQALLDDLKALNALPRLELHGLMALPPWSPDAEQSRPCFRTLRELKQRCEDALGASLRELIEEMRNEKIGGKALRHLSMGMSGDFEVAIEEGATIVRVGTSLFGARPKKEEE